MKFLGIVGNTSTTAFKNGRRIGHNVNAVAYERNDKIVLFLESNGSMVRGVSKKEMTHEEYAEFCEKQDRPLFIRGIELFDGVTAAL